MLGDAKGEFQIGQLLRRRRALGHDLQRHIVDDGVVAALREKAAGDGAQRQARSARIGQAAGQAAAANSSSPPTSAIASSSASGAMMTSVKISTIFRALAASSLPVQRDDAAEGRDRIAAQRLEIGLLQRRAFRDAAGVGVLDDRDRRRARGIEFRDAFEGRVGVVDVVVGELLALDLPRRGDAGALLAGEVEARRLMRILAVAHRLRQLAAERPPGRRRLAERAREPVGNRRVIGRRAREGLLREAATRRERRRARHSRSVRRGNRA